MSTFVNIAVNPKNNKPQQALFIDDYYGSHRYGVGFKNDGTDADLFNIGNIDSEYTVYPIEKIETDQDKSVGRVSD